MHNPVAAALASIAFGPEVVVGNLTMIPLLAKHQDSGTAGTPSTSSTRTSSTFGTISTVTTVDYLVLDDALAAGVVEITEVSEQGSVPDLKFINRGSRPVLIVDGEELLGAKQNRIVNLTILVAPDAGRAPRVARHRSAATGDDRRGLARLNCVKPIACGLSQNLRTPPPRDIADLSSCAASRTMRLSLAGDRVIHC